MLEHNDIQGYWGEKTATNWCEDNYSLTHYIAEFFNTLSSFCMVCVGIFGMYMHSKGFETRFLICFATIIVVGIGSILFHGTLLFSLQLFDEVPMMFCVTTLCYSIIENKKTRRFGRWFPIALATWCLLITSIMIFSGRYHHDKKMQLIEVFVFQVSFAIMAGFFYIYISLLMVRPKLYSTKHIKTLWITGSLVFLIGYIGWNVDMHFCSWMNQLPFSLPNPQLHAWWHLTASYGSYVMCVLVAYDRSKTLEQDICVKWVLNILPYVHIIASDEKKEILSSPRKRRSRFLKNNKSPDSNQEKVPLLRDSESDSSN
ncbi:4861_t:CDS:2 [Entrophospora sp. SA101]|nr:4861_t:CDS:2 [Entrophospora sp. SA101]CAJ0869425.1 1025_t:CDS:2 [Entrophospora sp. SA101]